ncbi:MAG: TIGR02328 family protein [Coprobacillus sp.]
MRLWHESLIPRLPPQQLLGQHREVCALRGMSWGKKHSVVDYVFTYPYFYLYVYHCLIMDEMEKRGYSVNEIWKDYRYRGMQLGYDMSYFTEYKQITRHPVYSEHNNEYLNECLDNLKNKGISIKYT